MVDSFVFTSVRNILEFHHFSHSFNQDVTCKPCSRNDGQISNGAVDRSNGYEGSQTTSSKPQKPAGMPWVGYHQPNFLTLTQWTGMRQKSKLHLAESIIELVQTEILSAEHLDRLSVYEPCEASSDQDPPHHHRETKEHDELLRLQTSHNCCCPFCAVLVASRGGGPGTSPASLQGISIPALLGLSKKADRRRSTTAVGKLGDIQHLRTVRCDDPRSHSL